MPAERSEFHVYALFADGGEDGEQAGDAEQGAEAFAQVDEDEFTAAVAGGDVEADQGAKAHAVGVVEAGEVEDDAPGVCHQGAYLGVEVVGDAGDEFAGEMDDGFVSVAHDLYLKLIGGRFGHSSPFQVNSGWIGLAAGILSYADGEMLLSEQLSSAFWQLYACRVSCFERLCGLRLCGV